MNNSRDNKQCTDESSNIPQDPQIKALLSTIHTSPSSDKLRQKVLQEAKKRLEQRTVLERFVGYIKLYFHKKKLGIKPGQKETRVIYSLVLTGLLISCSFIYVFFYLKQLPFLDNNLTATNISPIPVQTPEESTVRNFGNPEAKQLGEIQKVILYFPNDEKSQIIKTKVTKELLSHNLTITDNKDIADAMLRIEDNIIKLINADNIILWSKSLSMVDISSPILDDLFFQIQIQKQKT